MRCEALEEDERDNLFYRIQTVECQDLLLPSRTRAYFKDKEPRRKVSSSNVSKFTSRKKVKVIPSANDINIFLEGYAA